LLDHGIDLLGDFELDKMTGPDCLADGDRRALRRSAGSLTGTAEPIDSTGTLTLPSALAPSNSPMARIIAAATRGETAGIPRMMARLDCCVGHGSDICTRSRRVWREQLELSADTTK
jgi:hypothetical protein